MRKSELLEISYFNNKIKFKNSSYKINSRIKDLWNELRDDYTKFISDLRLKKIKNNQSICEFFTWNGMSIWWFNPLVERDTEYDTKWISQKVSRGRI